MLWRFLITLLSAGLILSSMGGAQATSTPRFTIYGDTPVLNHGDSGSWNAQYSDPGAVFLYKDTFYMFYNGFNGWPASVQIAYATSADGLHWTKHGTDPILKTDQVPYAKIAALASSVLVTEDGTWVLYLYTWESMSGLPTSATGRIGRATAPSPEGPWTVDPKPALEPGTAGAWDDLRVDAPSVLKTAKGYVMYYAGTSASTGVQRIGRAESEDGIHWHKADTPIFEPGAAGTWDAARVQQPRVVQTPDGWVMLYRTVVVGTPSTIALGIATSTDGLHWTRMSGNPIFRASEDFGKQGFWYTALAYKDGTYFAYVEAPPPDNSNQTAVYAATFKGSLIP